MSLLEQEGKIQESSKWRYACRFGIRKKELLSFPWSSQCGLSGEGQSKAQEKCRKFEIVSHWEWVVPEDILRGNHLLLRVWFQQGCAAQESGEWKLIWGHPHAHWLRRSDDGAEGSSEPYGNEPSYTLWGEAKVLKMIQRRQFPLIWHFGFWCQVRILGQYPSFRELPLSLKEISLGLGRYYV